MTVYIDLVLLLNIVLDSVLLIIFCLILLFLETFSLKKDINIIITDNLNDEHKEILYI